MSKHTSEVDLKAEPWDNGDLGRSLEHAKLVEDDLDKNIDSALHLQPISIRLEKSLIDAFKFIASRNKGMGYQPLMRQALHRFASGEVNKIAREMEAEARKDAEKQAEASEAKPKVA